jgi:hypothetical protein
VPVCAGSGFRFADPGQARLAAAAPPLTMVGLACETRSILRHDAAIEPEREDDDAKNLETFS